ncbi:MAG: hypothetical protein GX811_12460, partial [Lentisphaerae bacterium]|nr:hypothetical protein [Lentisphaerota bacterium]
PEWVPMVQMPGMMWSLALGLDPGRDLFAHMNPRVTSFSGVFENKSKSLSYWELKNPKEFAVSLDKLLSKEGGLSVNFRVRMDETDVKGFKVYSTSVSPSLGFDSISIAVANNYLVYGDSGFVKTALENLESNKNDDSALRNSEAFKKMKDIASSKVSSVSFIDWKTVLQHSLSESIIENIVAFKDVESAIISMPPVDTAELIKQLNQEKFLSTLFNTVVCSTETEDSMEWKATFYWAE